MAAEFYTITVDFVRPVFARYDRNGDGRLEYDEFKVFIRGLEPDKANWQIYAFFE